MSSAFITGGSNGMGLLFAKDLLKAGYQVTITGRNKDRLAQAFTDLEAEFGSTVVAENLHVAQADAASWSDTEASVEGHVEKFGGLDLVIANAGFGTKGNLIEGDPEEWQAMVSTNVLGPAFLFRAASEHLKASRGRIVFVGSVAGRAVSPGSLYSATKHAVASLSENVRAVLVGTGVKVTLLSPGAVATEFWTDAPPAIVLTPEDIAEALRWVVAQPDHVDINEILVRPVGQGM